jgi:hypothetical protein
MRKVVKQGVRVVGVIVLAVTFLVALLLALQVSSLSQVARSESIANSAGVRNDILPRSHARVTELNVDLMACGSTWVIATVDSAGNTGGQTSLALEPVYPYTPHISYHANPSGDPNDDSFVKHAWLKGATWVSETVDLGCGRTSLALVPTYPYTPCISYDDCQNNPRFAWLSGTTWISKTIPVPFAGDSSLALEPAYPYTPHISYFWAWGTARTLYHAYLSGTTWVSGTWKYDPVEPAHSEAGWQSSLALESTYPYTPHISYCYRIGDSDLRYAWLNGTTWLTDTVDSAGDVGKHTSLALDSSGNPHISYFDDTNNALKYAWLSGTTWFSKTVDNIGEPPYNRGRSSLELDQADVPFISYYDATNGDLNFAYLSGTVWLTQTVDSEGHVGQFSSLALDPGGCPHISYYDVTNGDLKYASLRWVRYLPVIFKNY